ncbi:MAG: hypothetical protein LC798_12715 [Chloroflexi bacterium]|nr:hypothetical protein [Chloroflexota bacterium]
MPPAEDPSTAIFNTPEGGLPPSLADLRMRSPLIRTRYPADPYDANREQDLQNAVDAAVALVESLTCRTIDETLPPEFFALAIRAIVLKAEQVALMSEYKTRRGAIGSTRLRSFTAGRYCVPMDTEALTPGGWRTYGDLCIGDLMLGFDPETEMTRWTPITSIATPFEADIVEMGNAHWKVRCTPEHRWVARDHRWCVREKDVPWEFVETADLVEGPVREFVSCGVFIPHSGRRGGPRQSCTNCGPRRRRLTKQARIRGRIYQKHYPEQVERVLATAEAPYSIQESPTGNRYSLNSPWLADLWRRARLDELTLSQFVLSLGIEEREAFLSAGMWAEAHLSKQARKQRPLRTYGKWYRWQFAQNAGPVLDAFVLAAHLCGYAARVWSSKRKCTGFLCGKPRHDTQKLRVRPAGRETVWCITTGLGSWTMRQGNVIALTGNSEAYFGPGDAKTAKVLDPDPALHEALWALATDECRERWRYEWGMEPEPASAVQTFDWRGTGYGEPRPRPGGTYGDWRY